MANWNMPAGAGSYDERCSDWGDEEPEPEPAILRSIPLGPDPLVDATLALDADGYLTITSASGTAVLWQAEARALLDDDVLHRLAGARAEHWVKEFLVEHGAELLEEQLGVRAGEHQGRLDLDDVLERTIGAQQDSLLLHPVHQYRRFLVRRLERLAIADHLEPEE